MSAASGFQPFPSNAKQVLADLKSLNPSLVIRGGGDLTGGFSERSPVLLSRTPDLFASAGQTLSGAVDREAPAIGARVGGLDVCAAVPVQAALPEKPASEMMAVNRPEWLPAGWTTGIKVRTSGATAGARDKYFYDPVSNRRFRSKKEVLSFLQTGKLGRYKPKVRKESDAHSTHSTDKDLPAGLNSKRKKFDFFSRPAKVRWVLDGPNGSWTPFIGDEELSESTKRAWMDALVLDGDEMDAFKE
ncbi:methyl-CpG-binding domain-containing protein 5-like isoform X1 [Nymphaea colorata]|uniref:methyl-CpG-binding domain-containing protein 5-like isoform X1 n=1 Tax=Nymphaea colorata TaxID=210225 RepID=UPI00129E92B7|nr:methyl-CpG-binding domain-containing protein 5-like isoform X1 [Nymphaea colorata]